jgi:Fe2+ or Zn2+ uptake regulation protein
MRLREAIWEAVRLRRNDFTAKEVRDLVAERGIRRTINAVNYHLEQFVEEGRVIRVPQPWPDVRKRVYRVRRDV